MPSENPEAPATLDAFGVGQDVGPCSSLNSNEAIKVQALGSGCLTASTVRPCRSVAPRRQEGWMSKCHLPKGQTSGLGYGALGTTMSSPSKVT